MSSMIINPYVFGAAAAAASISFIASTADDSDQTTYTFTAHAIGAADSTRRVVVVCHWFSSLASPRSMVSATIGGSAATIHVQGNNNQLSTSPGIAILSLLVPSGTTATIAFTLSGAALRARIGVFSAINESVASPFATASDITVASNAINLNLNASAGGWVLGGASIGTGAGLAVNWTGIGTEDYDVTSTETAGRIYSAAHENAIVAATPRTVTATGSAATTDAVGVAVTWI